MDVLKLIWFIIITFHMHDCVAGVKERFDFSASSPGYTLHYLLQSRSVKAISPDAAAATKGLVS